MAFIVYALPVLPGKGERLLRTTDEIADHRADYEALNRRAEVRRHLEFLQRSPAGDLHIVVFETDDPAKLGRAFTDSDYDRWWLARLKDLYGIDASGAPPPSPDVTQIWSWERDDR